MLAKERKEYVENMSNLMVKTFREGEPNYEKLEENDVPVFQAFVAKMFPELTEEQRMRIINVNLMTCQECLETIRPCYCVRDD